MSNKGVTITVTIRVDDLVYAQKTVGPQGGLDMSFLDNPIIDRETQTAVTGVFLMTTGFDIGLDEEGDDEQG